MLGTCKGENQYHTKQSGLPLGLDSIPKRLLAFHLRFPVNVTCESVKLLINKIKV